MMTDPSFYEDQKSPEIQVLAQITVIYKGGTEEAEEQENTISQNNPKITNQELMYL